MKKLQVIPSPCFINTYLVTDNPNLIMKYWVEKKGEEFFITRPYFPQGEQGFNSQSKRGKSIVRAVRKFLGD